MSRVIPPYPEGRSLLAGKTVLVTAAAGTGIGFAAAKRHRQRAVGVRSAFGSQPAARHLV